MLRKLSVRGKILATLAVPVLVLFIAAAMFSLAAFDDAKVAGQAQGVVDLGPAIETATQALSDERTVSVNTERGETTAKIVAARKVTDAALADLATAFGAVDTGALDARVSEALETALRENRLELVIIRDEQKRGSADTDDLSTSYTELVRGLPAGLAALAATLTDRPLAADVTAYVTSLDAADQLGAELPLMQAALVDASRSKLAVNRVYALTGIVADTNAARSTATSAVGTLGVEGLLVPRPNVEYAGLRRLLATGDFSAVTPDLAARWPDAVQAEINRFEPLVDTLASRTSDAATRSTASARTTAVVTVLVAMLAVAASVVVALLIARRITEPLKHLTKAATEVRDQLPKLVEQSAVPGEMPDFTLAEIPVESDDEVGQLAAAFNDVNHTTVEVAREQAALRGSIAEMFVNVARRDHVLLNRQLAFLDDLERSEEDPNILANLFRLDHLATRMRRNSESLLVLAGIDSGRRVRQPMPVSDVVRTASSEIELYDRVRLNLESDPLMLGHTALSAAHLVAELLENATMFSEPNTAVEVTTTRTKHFVTIEVRDHGLGMSAADIATANEKVASRSPSDVIGVQRLGLFVVGRLADRLGAHVVFGAPVDGSAGTVVTVSLPLALFVDESDVPLQMPTDPLVPATQQATQDWSAPEAAPAAQPVDLEALTDGSTSLGMPRRRASTPLGAALPDAAVAGAPANLPPADDSIVLPALESADPEVELSTSTDVDWAPEQTLAEALPPSLPSRSPGGASAAGPAVLEPVQDAPLLDGGRRSAMFSRFRTLNALEDGASALDAVAAERGATSPPPALVEDDQEPTWSTSALDSLGLRTPEPAPVQEPTLVVPALEPDDEPWAPAAPAVEDAWAPAVVLDEPFPADEPVAGHAGAFQPSQAYEPAAAYEPAVPYETAEAFEPAATYEPAAAFEPTATYDPTGAYQPLPDFEPEPAYAPAEAFEPLPAYEPQPIFAPEPVVEPAALWEPETAYSALPTAALAEEPSAPEQTFEAAPVPVAATPALSTRAARRALVEPEPRSSVFSAPAEQVVEPEPVVAEAPVVEAPAAAAAQAAVAPAVEPPAAWGTGAALPSFADVVADAPTRRSTKQREAPVRRNLFGRKKKREDEVDEVPAAVAPRPVMPVTRTGPASFAPAEPVAAPVQPLFLPEPAPVLATAPVAEPAAWAPAASPSGSTLPDLASGSWNPAPVPDTALAELGKIAGSGDSWTPPGQISSDMSSMLAMRSNIQEQALAELSQLSSYRPAAVETSQGGGLTRRTRGEVAESTDDLASQKISRDAAELRSRLSAFQSATSRGRQAPEADGPTAEAPAPAGGLGTQYVPDSAPQPR
jgi:signal transduction histidine kinase